MTAKSPLLVTAGFAFGIATASIADRPVAPRTGPPAIELHGGHVLRPLHGRSESDPSGPTLRPLSLRVGDETRAVGPSAATSDTLARVSLTVDGVPVSALLVMKA